MDEGQSKKLIEAKSALEGIINHIADDATVEAVEDEDRIILNIHSEHGGLIIGKMGQTLNALQYIVNRIVSKRMDSEERSKPVQVDTEGYRARREAQLNESAKEAAMEVEKTGKPVTFSDLTAAERRIVHMSLSGHEYVETVSEGQGSMRRLKIISKQ